VDQLVYLIIGLVLHLAIDGGLGIYVADQKGRQASEGFLFGMLLGPFGVIIVALLPNLDTVARAPDPPAMRRRKRAVKVRWVDDDGPASILGLDETFETEWTDKECLAESRRRAELAGVDMDRYRPEIVENAYDRMVRENLERMGPH
jgi:hypothetical protein